MSKYYPRKSMLVPDRVKHMGLIDLFKKLSIFDRSMFKRWKKSKLESGVPLWCNGLEERKLRTQTCKTPLKNWPCVISCPCRRIDKYMYGRKLRIKSRSHVASGPCRRVDQNDDVLSATVPMKHKENWSKEKIFPLIYGWISCKDGNHCLSAQVHTKMLDIFLIPLIKNKFDNEVILLLDENSFLSGSNICFAFTQKRHID